MAPTNKTDAPSSAWDKDRQFGNILGQVFGLGDEFLLVAARISEETIATQYGDATQATALVRKLDENGDPIGPVFEVSTVESAIVEKLGAMTEEDLPAVVRYHAVPSKTRGREAKVISLVRIPGESNEASLFEKYGVVADATTDDMAGFGVEGAQA